MTGPTGTDTTLFPSLNGMAVIGMLTNGDSMLGMVDGTAEKCAAACETLLGYIVALQQEVTSNNTVPGIASAPDVYSGNALQKVYANKLTELSQSLADHQQVVADMGHTFVNAGKAYQAAEHESAANFSSISFKNPAPASLTWAPQTQTVPGTSGTPSAPSGSTGASGASGPSGGVTKDSSIVIPAENANSLSWNDLYQLGQSINAQNVANFAGTWYQLASQWQGAITTFNMEVNSAATAGAWVGSGAQAATTAVNNYVTRATNMTNDLNALGDNIVYTSGWLQDTADNMPYDTHHECGDDSLDTYRQNFTNIYATGLNYTTGDIPLIADANPVTNSGPTGSPGPSGSDYGPTGSGSGPTGTATGPSGPTGANGYTNTGPTGTPTGTPNPGPAYSQPASYSPGSSATPAQAYSAPTAATGANPAQSNPAASYSAPTTNPAGSPAGSVSAPTQTPAASYSAPTGATAVTNPAAATTVSGATSVSGASGVSGSLTGVSGSTGVSGATGAAADELSIFGEVLQLLESGIPAMQQLGAQLLQQLPPALQQLGQQVENGSMSIRHAIQQAATDLGVPSGPTGPFGQHHDHDHHHHGHHDEHNRPGGQLFPRAAMPAESAFPAMSDSVMAGVPGTPAIPFAPAFRDEQVAETGPAESVTD